jgi:SAM-dependent methyltransferase
MFPLPPQDFMDAVAGAPIDGTMHVAIGKVLRDFVADQCKIGPDDTVLDLGCGCGRIAAHFAEDFAGEYHGLDIVKPMIDWCRDNITEHHQNFHFHHADLANTCYQGGSGDAATYAFPFPDKTFDVVFATSVFTHLLPPSAKNYAREIARIMKPGGRAMMSFYLLTDEWRRRVAAGEALFPTFAYELDGCRVWDDKQPEVIVGYEESAARFMLADAGLPIKMVNYGSLTRPRPNEGVVQDCIIVSRPTAGPPHVAPS